MTKESKIGVPAPPDVLLRQLKSLRELVIIISAVTESGIAHGIDFLKKPVSREVGAREEPVAEKE
jgi:hypothetical protein